jgi:DNA-binding NtrC family response regulator
MDFFSFRGMNPGTIMTSSLNLLTLDKDPDLYNEIKDTTAEDWNIFYFDIQNDYFSFIRENVISAVLIDIDKNPDTFLNILYQLKEFDPYLEILLIGSPLPSEKVLELIHEGATEYLPKPFDKENLITALNEIKQKKNLRRETFKLEKRLEKKYYFQDIIGKSPYMLEIFSLVEKIAKHFKCILITGETGTGKELIAKAIHKLAGTENKNLVICDCVSIPENLFESELFGYAKGAFTGADRDKKGLFEEADNGIIFLDEIGDLPISVQSKFLRVIENNQFRAIGSNEPKNVNVKIITATNRDLRTAVKQESFREDLFHRLNRIEIHLPPLRERTEDIPLLARNFLKNYNQKFSKDLKGISREVQKLFTRYHWPGNVRELENVLESAALVTKKEFIDISDLPKYMQEPLPESSKIPFLSKNNLGSLDDLEKEYIKYLLKLNRYNMRKTARILNISRTTLYNKLKKYDILR